MNSVCDRKIEEDRAVPGNDGDAPIQEILRPFCADGSPIYAGGKIKDETVNDGTYKMIDLFLGGFHLLLETINKKSELVEDLARFIVSQYRTTTKRQDWVLFPTDPNQAQDESIPTYAALWRAAIDGCKTVLGTNTVTALQVHRFMLDRAKQKPMAMMMLIEMRLQEICLMLRDAEKCRSLDLFISALRLAQTVFSVTGAYKYVRICCDLLVWYETASTAQKVIKENFVFVQLTADGKSMYTDRFQEKINHIFRREMGHIVLPGHERKMYKVASRLESIQMAIKEEKSVKNLVPTKPRKDFNESEATEDNLRKVFVTVYAAIVKMNIWGNRKASVYPNGTNKAAEIALNDKLQAPSGTLLNADLLSFFPIALERLESYFDEYFIHDAFAVSRSTANLKRIALSTTKSKAIRQRDLVLAMSTDPEEIKKAAGGKKAPIIAKIVRAFHQIPANARLPPNTQLYRDMDGDELKKKRVRDLAQILSLVRRQLSKKKISGNQQKEERRFTAMAEEEASTSVDRRSELLNHPFFKLDENVINQFKY